MPDTRASAAREYSSVMWLTNSSLMPMPLSRQVKRQMPSGVRVSETSILPPWSVYLMALETMLMMICA